ncbi:probably inactive leucine-rich repeat receptor-like protein kinase At5g48380 [Andrographis paniculata]|uniref:probably inactive leucine-rich repeat receptor-like protein kinase At5g48380 n=1 Tax=Andrographis paniculata TaxID=175694 RepID=UPI0021E70ABB|nr:probably inactive leucine-rich repeat receptor-like protein kinase At5g48380 [Andrographis paniculata]XP_051143792.1 probably inactive leucine-rich repeat receptor-like protein kinase At5g48380 [Andrographis paniculata]XP_051143794.1 probably inactive leucine-rich repeat receptor-like protein kinase At5g48380 [Andrographis paniculata]XP_051143795.1 probably inactive leucine-rich repeat receptor-like protein kinase At5g48380 [Andrographis paniculata]XP_051143796.1 probably inactive leucine-ri
MASDLRAIRNFVGVFVLFLLIGSFSDADQSDIDCLRKIYSSLKDPLKSLSLWNFNNTTPGFICKFPGIECWHEDEDKVLNIRLSDMGLQGEFPMGLSDCKSMTGLDLSNNKIRGIIPSNISDLIKYITNLDLSSNQFSGEIPPSIVNCTYLNELKLNDNQLTGKIPPEIGQLGRLKKFSVAKNHLNGTIPHFSNGSFSADSYSGNPLLCGYPLPPCQGSSKKAAAPAIVGAAVGGVVVGALGLAIGMYIYLRKMKKWKKEEDPLGNKWARSIKGAKRIKISMFEKIATKMSLKDLMKATDSFSNENIIGLGRTGTMYKAVLEDGTTLMVKRLQDTQHSEKEFVSEMATLGSVKHNNLVPLIGFCMTKKERLLVYKHMPNGNLHDKLHNATDKILDWATRLKIATRAAKGFAWLHHSCNPRIIHRNISSSCILLDSDYEPKISDFGLARLMNPIDTHLSTFVNGEFGDLGYVAPEYTRTLVATPKGDVYSFGVVILELVTREKPTYVGKAPEGFRGNLVEWISGLSTEGRLKDAVDEAVAGKGCDGEVFQVLKVACNCVLPGHKERPTMFEVYQLLRAIGDRYDFTTEEDVLVLPEGGGAGDEPPLELIVARDVQEHH